MSAVRDDCRVLPGRRVDTDAHQGPGAWRGVGRRLPPGEPCPIPDSALRERQATLHSEVPPTSLNPQNPAVPEPAVRSAPQPYVLSPRTRLPLSLQSEVPPTSCASPRTTSRFLPRIHFSDRYVTVSFLLPWQGPMKRLAWRGTPVTRPPHRRTSSHSLALGGSLAGEMNIVGWSANSVPWYCPADRWCSWRQSCGQRHRVRPEHIVWGTGTATLTPSLWGQVAQPVSPESEDPEQVAAQTLTFSEANNSQARKGQASELFRVLTELLGTASCAAVTMVSASRCPDSRAPHVQGGLAAHTGEPSRTPDGP